MNLEPVGPFKWDAQGTDVVVVDVYVDEYELERNIGEVHLTQSIRTGLIPIQDYLVNLLLLIGIKLNHRQEILSY